MTTDNAHIPIALVTIPTTRHRRVEIDDEVRSLARDISHIGLLHPVHVREQANGGWRLISGARRLLAHQVLGLETIEACIHPKSSAEMTSLEDELIEISENLQRQKLTPLEEATHIRRYDELLDTLGLRARRGQPRTATRRTTAQLADELGMSERTYRNRLSVGRLPKAVQEAAKDSSIASKRTELTRLARLGDEQLQVAVLETIASGVAAGVDDAVTTLARPAKHQLPSPSRGRVEELLPTSGSDEVLVWETMSQDRWLNAFPQAVRRLQGGVLITPAPGGRQLLDIRRYLSDTQIQHQAWIIVGNTVWAAWSRRSDITWPAAVDSIASLRSVLEETILGAQKKEPPHQVETERCFLDNDKAAQRTKLAWSDERISSNNVLMLLIALATEMGSDDRCTTTQMKLSTLARIGKTSLNRHLEEAVELGYVRRESGQGRSPTVYSATGAWINELEGIV